MTLKNYGVLKGKAIDSREGMGASPHFQVLIVDDDLRHRIAINVKSKVGPSELLYYVDENFNHPMVTELESLPPGFHEIPSEPGGWRLTISDIPHVPVNSISFLLIAVLSI